MANLTATPGLDDVPQLETSTLALGGAGAIMNAQAQALLNRVEQHRSEADNPHGVTKTHVGLGNVDNTSDATKLAATIAALLAQNNTYTKAQRGAYVVLTSSAASIAVDLALSNNFAHDLTENTTLAAPTNVVPGQSGIIRFKNHASAPKTLAFNAFWKFAGGTVPALTAANGAVDALSYVTSPDGAYAICSMLKDVK